MSWQPLRRLARNEKVRDLVGAVPVDRPMVARFVTGETPESAVEIAEALAEAGISAGIEWLVGPARDGADVDAATTGYLDLVDEIRKVAVTADITVRPHALGLGVAGDGPAMALESVRAISIAAGMASATVTLEVSDAGALELAEIVVREFPTTGVVLLGSAADTVGAVRAHGDGRVRIHSGSGDGQLAPLEADKLFVRNVRTLMDAFGRPGIATHESRLIRIAAELARRSGRAPESYEFVLPYGVRPDEARRLVEASEQVRVTLPFGREWAPYVASRLAERPGNLVSSFRSFGASLVPQRKEGS